MGVIAYNVYNYIGGGVLAPNGKIYFAPAAASQVLSVDPETQTAELIGPEMRMRAGTSKYSGGGVLAPNGKIYFAPSDADKVLSVDPETQTAELIGPDMGCCFPKYSGAGVL